MYHIICYMELREGVQIKPIRNFDLENFCVCDAVVTMYSNLNDCDVFNVACYRQIESLPRFAQFLR